LKVQFDAINSSNTQGLVADNYTNMINLLSNKDEYRFNILTTPGLTNDLHTSTISTIIGEPDQECVEVDEVTPC
jgi:hypothetical protein